MRARWARYAEEYVARAHSLAATRYSMQTHSPATSTIDALIEGASGAGVATTWLWQLTWPSAGALRTR